MDTSWLILLRLWIVDEVQLKFEFENSWNGCTAIVLTTVNNTANANAANIFMLSSYVLEINFQIFKF